MNTNKLISKYIIIISLIFLFFLVGRIYYDYIHQQKMLLSKLDSFSSNITEIMDIATINLIKNYQMITEQFINSQTVYNLVKNNEREKLYNYLKTDYENFKKIDPNLFVMHFFNTDNITILRMHKPNSYNDDLTKKRPIVAYVNKSLQQQYAFEVGKNGMVYRITSPFIYKNEHIGVLEFGIKLSYFTNILKQNKHNITYAHLVKTEKLHVLTAQKKYASIKDYSIVSQNSMFNSFKDLLDISKEKQLILKDDKAYLVFATNLNNYTGEIVSKIITIEDVSAIVNANKDWFILINISSVLVFIFVIVLMYFILKKFSKDIEHKIKTINKLHKNSQLLKTKAYTDELTSAYNKRYFDKYLEHFLDTDSKGCLLFLDIDHFKEVNDTYGHLAGDEILKNLSKTIQQNLRGEDLFARWGGEEFAIILKDTPFSLACKKAEKLRVLIESTKMYQNITVTISIGLYEINTKESKEVLLKKTDKLLYTAKKNGRNLVICENN